MQEYILFQDDWSDRHEVEIRCSFRSKPLGQIQNRNSSKTEATELSGVTVDQLYHQETSGESISKSCGERSSVS